MTALISFLNRLQEAKISYSLEYNRQEAIMVLVAVPGERWEVEFFEGGAVEVERFISNGVDDEQSLDDLLLRFSD